ncbi:hypothetical protein DEJ28_07695 [Curtobacterium sp. MCPF17_002]|uniref:hypothetical protein n=1 Tax=Curtobacterium sp. MCPF17_002 TaxID=2175645 RepID=UPI000DAA639F|nr:hypothetical protein [Curtobacterium sp. MCPF17_002]WIB78972.1 hypothetical protein DEJ28_07695 [Curtobacterium sp. MCPF17_002]
MNTVRRALAAGALVAVAIGLVGCTAEAESDPEDSIDTSATAGVSASGTAPIVFAFVCAVGSSDDTETYTTYSAVWEDERTDCQAQRITGTEMSSQQRAAVQAAAGDATLEELAAGCAVRRTGPWTRAVGSVTEAHVAAGLLEYCPGHPETDHLRDAVAAWRS